MKTIYRLDGKKITKKALTEKIGADRVKRLTEEAKETFREDHSSQTTSLWVALGCLISSLNFKGTAGGESPQS